MAEDLISPVAIVESEKTAIIALAKMPEYLWLPQAASTTKEPNAKYYISVQKR